MMELWQLSAACMTITGVLCILGTLSRRYSDNLLQRAGMAVLCFGCFARAHSVWGTQVVLSDWLMVHVGITLIAVGTTVRVLRRAKWDGVCRRKTDFDQFNDMPLQRDFGS